MSSVSLNVMFHKEVMCDIISLHSNKFERKGFIAAQLLGHRNNIPPHARTRGPAILRGLNFASGAAGIREETGNNLVSYMLLCYPTRLNLSSLDLNIERDTHTPYTHHDTARPETVIYSTFIFFFCEKYYMLY